MALTQTRYIHVSITDSDHACFQQGELRPSIQLAPHEFAPFDLAFSLRSLLGLCNNGTDRAEVICDCVSEGGNRVIIAFLSGWIYGLHAASFSFMAGVIPPMPMFGRWLL